MSLLRIFRPRGRFLERLLFFLFFPLLLAVFYKGGIGTLGHLVLFLSTALVAMALLYGYLSDRLKQREFPFFENVWLIVFVTGISLSYIFSEVTGVGMKELGAWYAGIILLFLGYQTAENKTLFITVIRWLLFVVLLSLITGFVFYFSLPFERFAGSFYNHFEPWSAFPNAYGDFLLLTLPLAFILIEYSHAKKERKYMHVFTYTVLTLGIAGIYLTASEGIYLAAIGVYLILLLRAVFSTRKFTPLIVPLVLGLVIGIGAHAIKEGYDVDYREQVTDRTPEQFEQSVSIDTRKDHYRVSAELLKEVPLFGFGPGSYRYISASRVSLLNVADHPHNLFLKLALENGYISAVAFGIFLLIVLIRIIHLFGIKYEPGKEILVASLLGFLAHQMIDFNLNFITVSGLFFFLLGCTIPSPLHRFKQFHVKDLHKVNSVLLVGSAIIILVFVAQLGTQQVKGDTTMLIDNPYDAEQYALLGNYTSAYELNPHNLLYLLGLYEHASPLEQKVLRPSIQQTLTEYGELLRINANLTVLTNNPKAAISLARAIGNDMLAQELSNTYRREKEKFELFYRLNK